MLTGERRAVAAAVLAFYGFMNLLAAFTAPEEWARCYGGLAGVYGVGFVSLVAGYFWARWYVVGIGLSGLITAVFGLWQVGLEPVLMFYGGTHGLIAAALIGRNMSSIFDGRADWRDRFKMDADAADRLGKAVTRAAVSLPAVVVYALAPSTEGAGDSMAGMAGMPGMLAVLGTVFAAGGLWGLIRARTWGVLALGGAAVATGGAWVFQLTTMDTSTVSVQHSLLGLFAVVLLASAVAPFSRPVVRFLTGRIRS